MRNPHHGLAHSFIRRLKFNSDGLDVFNELIG